MRGIANPLTTGPFSATIPDTAGLIGIPNSASGSSLSNDLLPWLINVDVFQTPVSQVNWSSIAVSSLLVYTGYVVTTGAQNAEINFDVVLAAGTWTFELLHVTGDPVGIYTVQLDGVEAGTIDGYSGGFVYNVRASIAGISVAATGKKRLKIIMATKNASASGYYGYAQHIQFKRTA